MFTIQSIGRLVVSRLPELDLVSEFSPSDR